VIHPADGRVNSPGYGNNGGDERGVQWVIAELSSKGVEKG
jgi:hypothetical protein